MAKKTRWVADPTHSSIEFSVKHMMITTVRGRFRDFTVEVLTDDEIPDNSYVTAEIDVASIDTGVADRDNHLRSADFFNVEKHPKIRFRSRQVNGAMKKEGDRFRVIGDLTICTTTIEVELDASFDGRGTDPWGNERVGFSAAGEIDRRDWGLRWNQVIETGGVLVANAVKIQAEVQCVRQAEAAEPAQAQAGEEARP